MGRTNPAGRMHIEQSAALDFSELKQFADNNLNFDENGRKFSKVATACLGKGSKGLIPFLTLYHTILSFDDHLTVKGICKHCEKR